MHSPLLWGECVGTCVLSAAVYAELVALLICTADGGVPSRIPKPLLQAFMVLWTCLCTTLLSPVQFAMPDAASFPFSHIGEHYPDFSFFYCKILLLNIPWPFLVPCAFSPYLPRMPLHRVHPQQLCGQGRTRGVADVLKSRALVQRDLEKLGDSANRNFLKLSSETCKVLHCGWENPIA